MIKNYLWVIEMLEDKNWVPTCGCHLKRNDARNDLSEWKERIPCADFRIVKYAKAPVEEKKEKMKKVKYFKRHYWEWQCLACGEEYEVFDDVPGAKEILICLYCKEEFKPVERKRK
jgi:hypothetical protein